MLILTPYIALLIIVMRDMSKSNGINYLRKYVLYQKIYVSMNCEVIDYIVQRTRMDRKIDKVI